MPPIILHGTRDFALTAPKVTRAELDLDRMTQTFQSSRKDAFLTGHAPPGFPNMRIVEVEEEEEVIGEAYVNRLQCEGIAGAVPWKTMGLNERSPQEGWDEVTLSILTREPHATAWQRGQTLPGYSDVYIVDRDRAQHRARGYYDLTLVGKGSIAQKPLYRRGSTNGNTIQPDVDFAVSSIYNDRGEIISGWSGSHPAELSLAKTVVTDSFISTTEPPTNGIPGNVTPPSDALVPDTYEWAFTTTGSVRYHWPYGWRRAAVQWEQVYPGVSLWLVQVTYEWQQMITPG